MPIIYVYYIAYTEISFFFNFHKSTAQVVGPYYPVGLLETGGEKVQWIPPAPFSLSIFYYNQEHGAYNSIFSFNLNWE